MNFKSQLFDEIALRRAVTRISYEIVEKSDDLDKVIIVGIKTRGIPIAKMIAENIKKNSGYDIKTAELDITLYRDDLSAIDVQPVVNSVSIPYDVNGMEIVLIDDVLFTGRTARAAIDALFLLGRPGKIRLAVLIDRGHRELPIRPDYVGKNVPTSMREVIKVNVEEVDGRTNVEIYERSE